MSSFNLNIDEYNDDELKELLSLDTYYTIDDVDHSVGKLRSLMTRNDDFEPEKRHQVLFFLDSVYHKLKNNLLSVNTQVILTENNPTSERNMDGTWSEKVVPVEEYGSNILIIDPNSIKGKKAQIIEHDNPDIVPPGYINPINIRTTKQIITIDSRFRENYFGTNASNYTLELPEPQKKVTSLHLKSAIIPFSYYTVSKALNNNAFVVVDVDVSGNTNDQYCWKISLPDGNYHPSWFNDKIGDSLETYINNLMGSQNCPKGTWSDIYGFTSHSVSASVHDLNLNYTINKVNGRSIFSGPAHYKICFNVNSDGTLDTSSNIQLKLGWMLGFRNSSSEVTTHSTEPIYTDASFNTTSNIYSISEGIVMMLGPKYGFLAVNDYKTNSSSSIVQCFTNSVLDKNILARLDLGVERNENIAYKLRYDSMTDQVNYTRNYFGPVDINKLQFSLYDEFGRILELNNMDWVCSIEFTCLYS